MNREDLEQKFDSAKAKEQALVAWSRAHPAIAGAIVGFVAGFVLGVWLF